MTRRIVIVRLRRLGRRLGAARIALGEVGAQAAALTDEADDLELRALVNESPLTSSEARSAAGHRAAMRRERDRLVALIASLEAEQDRLLDRLGGR